MFSQVKQWYHDTIGDPQGFSFHLLIKCPQSLFLLPSPFVIPIMGISYPRLFILAEKEQKKYDHVLFL